MLTLAFLMAVEYWRQSVVTLANKSMIVMMLTVSPTASAMASDDILTAEK